MRMGISKPQNAEVYIALVVTVPEICAIWHKTRKTVDMQIAKGRLAARQSVVGNTWLVSTDSVVTLWGKPERSELTDQIFKGVK